MKRTLTTAAVGLALSAAMAGTAPVVWFNMEETNSLGQVKNLGSAGSASDLTFATWDCSLTNESAAGQALYSPGTEGCGARFSCPDLTDRTISFWIRRDVDTGPYTDSSYPNFISGGPGDGMRIIFSKTGLGMTVYLGNVVIDRQEGQPILNRGYWQHLAFVFRKTSGGTVDFRCYRDGMLLQHREDIDIGATSMGGGARQMVVGGNGGNRPICCWTDEFRVWDRALSPDEVSAEYGRVAASVDRTLIAHWRMDAIEEADGDRWLRDSSPWTNDLQVGPGVTIADDALKGPVARTDGTKSTWAKATFPVRVADYTLTAWVNQSSDTVYDHIGKIGTSNGGARFFLGTDTLIFTMSINNAGVVIGSNTFYPTRAAKDSWSHMAMRVRHVWNEDTLSYSRIHTFFMNGVATTGMVTEAAKPTWAGANANLYMFNMSTTSALDRPYEGRASDVRLYARALGDAEIAEIARGPAAVSAGGDFSTPDAVAVLRGTVAPHGSDWFVDGFAGTVRWEQVSAPAGAAAEIATPESAVTRVTLPAEGTYRFRLTATADRFTNAAEVAVTRLAAMAAAPSVSLPASASVARPLRLHLEGTASGAERVFWRKASGPGGVWFEPSDATATDVTFSGAGTYVLRLTAENGGASASADVTVAVTDSEGTVALDDGLKFHWPMDIGNLAMERITGMSDAIRPDYTNSVFTKGARLHGVASVSDVGYATTRCRMTDFERSADGSVGNSAFVTNEWAAVAMWIYRDSRLTYETRAPFLFSAHQTLGLRFGRWDNYGDGFTLQQQGSQGGTGSLSFGAPTRSMVDRWTHVYALYSRADGAAAKFALYIDGVKQTPASSSGFPRPARMPVVDIEIGGIKPGRQVGPAMGNVARPEGGYYSASFPGTIDDVRVYGRPLTEAEIRTLASRPNLSENLPPVFSIDTPLALDVVARKNVALPLAVFDDGIPTNGTLSCAWQLKSGDGNNVVLSDETDPSTTVRFMKSGMYVLQLVATDGERTSYSPPITANVCPIGTAINIR